MCILYVEHLAAGCWPLAFVAANHDDLFLQVGFFSDPVVRRGRVIAGQYLGSGILGAHLMCHHWPVRSSGQNPVIILVFAAMVGYGALRCIGL
jgi:hypothetical protein